MDFLFWSALGLGVFFIVVSLLILVLEILVERGKPDGRWGSSFQRFWQGTGGTLLGGAGFVIVALFLRSPDTGFRAAMVALGVVGAIAPLAHLAGSMMAAKESKPPAEREWWQAVSDRSGQAMVGCAYAAFIVAAVYSVYSLYGRVDEMATRVRALEQRVDELKGNP